VGHLNPVFLDDKSKNSLFVYGIKSLLFINLATVDVQKKKKGKAIPVTGRGGP
jgi:hypothetical protein